VKPPNSRDVEVIDIPIMDSCAQDAQHAKQESRGVGAACDINHMGVVPNERHHLPKSIQPPKESLNSSICATFHLCTFLIWRNKLSFLDLLNPIRDRLHPVTEQNTIS
jgi:hypothetical protein